MAAFGHDHAHESPLVAADRSAERSLPPIQQISVAVLVLIVIGGIYLASHLPRHFPLGPAIALLIASTVVLIVNLALLRRVEAFAWDL